MKVYPRDHSPRSVKVIAVVCVEWCDGEGIEANPLRLCRDYYDLDGTLLARADPCAVEAKEAT